MRELREAVAFITIGMIILALMGILTIEWIGITDVIPLIPLDDLFIVSEVVIVFCFVFIAVEAILVILQGFYKLVRFSIARL